MLTVFQFCPDGRSDSGVNTFCTELDRALSAEGIDSRIIRSFSALQTSHVTHPYLLHIHGLWRLSNHRAARWARAHGIPVVWSTHGMTAPWALSHKRWKKFLAWWLYQKRDLARAALVHCTSEKEAEWNADAVGLRGRDTLAASKFPIIPLGTRLPDLEAARASRPRTGSLKVLFVGRIYPVKGLVNLVRAAAQLQDVEFRIVGADEAGHLAEVKREISLLSLPSPVFAFPGPKYGEELSKEYDACDLLVLPSHSENFGAVVVDALAHAKPVIASTGTPWQILAERRCGWWVENSPDSLVRAIEEARTSPLEAMGARGRALVAERFTWPAVARQMIKEYERVLCQ